MPSADSSLRPIYVIGTGGLAREIAQLLRHVNAKRPKWSFEGFIAASTADVGRDLGYGRVVGDDAWLLSQTGPVDVVVGIGHPAARRRALAAYLERGNRFGHPNLIHPSVMLDADRVRLGRGNTIGAGCVLTCDIVIGDFNHLNWLVTVGHDARIGDYDVINPGSNVSGGVQLGDGILVGTGAQILEGIAVGSDATVGAGAVVVKPVEAGTTVVGIPAKSLTPRA